MPMNKLRQFLAGMELLYKKLTINVQISSSQYGHHPREQQFLIKTLRVEVFEPPRDYTGN